MSDTNMNKLFEQKSLISYMNKCKLKKKLSTDRLDVLNSHSPKKIIIECYIQFCLVDICLNYIKNFSLPYRNKLSLSLIKNKSHMWTECPVNLKEN